MLWPQNAADGECAESDFPEIWSSLNGGSLDSGEVDLSCRHDYGVWTPQSGCPSTTRSQDSWNTPIEIPASGTCSRRIEGLVTAWTSSTGKHVYTTPTTSQVWVTARALADSDGSHPRRPRSTRPWYRRCRHLLGLDRQVRVVTHVIGRGRRAADRDLRLFDCFAQREMMAVGRSQRKLTHPPRLIPGTVHHVRAGGRRWGMKSIDVVDM